MSQIYERLMKSYEYCKRKIEFTPKVALVLGSGLGHFADTVQIVGDFLS